MPSPKDPLRAIIIRNVPESLRRELKAKAAKEGKSMQAVLVELITMYVESRRICKAGKWTFRYPWPDHD